MSLNRATLIGNLTRSPEIRYTPKGTAVAEIGLAINRKYTTDQGEKREEVVFLNVTFWGKQAEILGEWAKKGAMLYVEARLTVDKWDDKATGQPRSAVKLIGESFQFLGGKREEAEERPSSRPESRPPARKQPPKPPVDPDLDADDDSIPF